MTKKIFEERGRHMYGKNKANIVLAVVFAIFIFSLILKQSYGGSFIAGLLYFVSESALIGGVADWFAVTALFTKPLGFSWHTALIPNNRAALTESVVRIVKKELLSVDSIGEKVGTISSVDLISSLIGKNGGDESLGELSAKYIHEKINSMDRSRVAGDIEIFLKENAKEAEFSVHIKNSLKNSLESGRSKEWISWLAVKAAEALRTDTARQSIYKIIKDLERSEVHSLSGLNSLFIKTLLSFSKRSEHTNIFALAALIQDKLAETLEEMKNPAHPLHAKIEQRLRLLVENLEGKQALNKSIELWKEGVIGRVAMKEPLEKLIESVLQSGTLRTVMTEWISRNLDLYWEQLKQNPEDREWIDEIIKSALVRIITMEHYLIGEIVRETLDAFTDEKLNKFVEDRVGDDLQWIRINGSIVGGAAGLLLYLFMKLLYDPYLLTFIQGWFTV